MSKEPSKKKIWKFRFFTIWKERHEEIWLREMSKQGWHLYRVLLFFYFFEKGEPTDYIYKFDFYGAKLKQHEQLMQPVNDSGWEFVTIMGSWYYFRIKADGRKDVELLTTPAQKIKKYRRLLSVMTLVSLPLLYFPIVTTFIKRYDSFPDWLKVIGLGGYIMLVSLFIFSVIHILRKISRLKKQPNG